MPTIAPPAPSAPPKNGATATPSSPAPETPAAPEPSHLSDSMRELEAMEIPEDRPPPKPPEAAKAKKGEVEDDGEPKDTHSDKAKEPEPAKPPKAAELRTAYEKSKETIKARDAEIARLQTELKTAKDKPADDPEKKMLLEKLEATEKKRSELDKKLRLLDYKQHEDFQTKYDKPYREEWSKAASELAEFSVMLENGEERQANAEDLLKLCQMNPREARNEAKRMFGEVADDVMAMRRKIRELSDAQTKALEDAEKNAETHRQEQQTQSLQQRQKIATLWQDENKAWQEKFPRWFKPEDGDEEGNSLLAKGYEMADAAFSNNGDKTPEERVKLHAELRNKAAAFPKLALKLKQAKTRIKELEKSLKEFEQSEPPSGGGGKARAVKPGDAWSDPFSEIEEMAKK